LSQPVKQLLFASIVTFLLSPLKHPSCFLHLNCEFLNLKGESTEIEIQTTRS